MFFFLFQISLSRHVNSHFKPPATPAGPSGRGRPAPDTPIKFYIRKTRRKNRLRPNPLVNNIGKTTKNKLMIFINLEIEFFIKSI